MLTSYTLDQVKKTITFKLFLKIFEIICNLAVQKKQSFLMKRILRYAMSLLILVTFLLQSCAPSMNAEWSKPDYSKQPAKTILVIALTQSLESRQSLESNIVNNLKDKHNYVYYKGLDLFPPNQSEYTEEQITDAIQKNNIDIILTTSFVKAYNSKVYVPGDDAYVPYYYNVGRQIYSTYDIISTPGYYENIENFVLVSNLYDLREGSTEKSSMVWQGESEVMSPSTVSSGAYDYAKNLVRYLDKNDILP